MTPAELLALYSKGRRSFSSSQLSKLQGALLSEVRLVGTDLGGANFRDADLSGSHLYGCDLWGADFRNADLRRATLNQSQLSMADCRGAKLDGATFHSATLDMARLEEVDLRGVKLSSASLRQAKLPRADLRGALLYGVDFAGATVDGSLFDDARLHETRLLDLDLTPFLAANLIHNGPSHVDWRSIAKSVANGRLHSFLVAVGIPDIFATYLISCAQAIDSRGIFSMMQSTFISYGYPDEPFARRLHAALELRKVPTFFFPEHAPPGEKLHRVMHTGVNKYDRVILICSQKSLDRPGVLNEVEQTLAREARDGGATYLLPIRLDDYVFRDWKPSRPDIAQAVRDRVVADFTGAETSDDAFEAAITKLVRVLIKPEPV